MDNEEDQVSIGFRLLDTSPRAAVVTARGTIQSPEAVCLRDTLDHVDAKKARRVMLDLKEVPYMSSSGISVIVGYCKTKAEQEGGGAVALVGLAPGIQNIMRSLGLSSVVPHFRDLLSAAKALGLQLDVSYLDQAAPE